MSLYSESIGEYGKEGCERVKYARKNEDGKKQLLSDHINGVTHRLREYAGKEFENTTALIGYLHDMGKYSEAWQNYLLTGGGGKVPHSPHGAHFIRKIAKPMFNDLNECILVNIAMYVILAHHGIFDAYNLDGKDVFSARIDSFESKYSSLYSENEQEFLKEYSSVDFLALFEKAKKEIAALDVKSSSYLVFDIGVIIRMLLSMTIDADWSDAAAFTTDVEKNYSDRMKDFSWELLTERIEEKLRGFVSDRPLDIVRRRISEECLAKSVRPEGIYKLDVPTGGGKTLAVMRYALHHAKIFSKKRIFYVAPYISILEQNAELYRNIFVQGEEEEHYVLSHYSDVVRLTETDNVDDSYDFGIAKYLIDNWSAPVILTTMVQFLLTMFSARKQSVRRMHQLSNSVVIIDEFQSIPLKSTGLFNMMLNALSKYFHCTVILCTATQPPFEKDIRGKDCSTNLPKVNYCEEPDLVSSYEDKPEFYRTRIEDKRVKGGYDKARLVNFIMDKSESLLSLLVVLNTRKAVHEVYQELRERSKAEVFALNNDMCPAHRNKVLNTVKQKLMQKQKVILVSTSLIEAGVDISFAGGIRSLAGLDVITQTAGRINRNNELPLSSLWIINANSDLEKITKMFSLQTSQGIVNALLDDYRDRPGAYENRIAGKRMLEKYFLAFYEKMNKETLYPLPEIEKNVLYLVQMIADNSNVIKRKKGHEKRKDSFQSVLTQSFYAAGSRYQAIEDNSIGIVVPFEEGETLILKLNSDESPAEKAKLLRNSSYYSIGVYQHIFNNLSDSGALIEIEFFDQTVYALKSQFYGESGLNLEGGEMNGQDNIF